MNFQFNITNMKQIHYVLITLLLLPAAFFSGCTKNNPPPPPIAVTAGSDQLVQLPVDSVKLTGTVTSGQSPTLIYAWTLVSGPNQPTIAIENTTVADINNLVAGTYIFQFAASNAAGTQTGVDTVSVVVLPVHAIKVDAGVYQSLQLPIDSTTLTGTVLSGLTANTTYLWTILSGPSVPVFGNSDSATTSVKGLIAGTYVLQFQATNSYSQTGVDTVSITVLPANSVNLTIQPSDNPYEGFIYEYQPTGWFTDNELNIIAWTVYGTPEIWSTGIKFDFSSIPSNATIDKATLYLYAMPNPHGGNSVDAAYGTSNACNIQRITSSWASPTPSFTWDTPPTVTTTDEAVIPQSVSASENDSVIVTNLVQDMQVYGNNGFFISLQNQTYYNCRIYASSFYSDSTLHPKLVISYH